MNPFLPDYEYVPDGEPHIFGDRVYLYGSHDRFGGFGYCLNDYVCWSADVNDLKSWRYEGVIYKRSQSPGGRKGMFNALYAPDVCRGADGRYYLYYFLAMHGIISVAVCDSPAGKYEYLGDVHYKDGRKLGKKGEGLQFDPGIFRDEGKTYLYTGFAPFGKENLCPMVTELCDDMLTVKTPPRSMGIPTAKNSRGTEFENNGFFEASSMRKRGDKYIFIYSTEKSHDLAWAVSDNPVNNFSFGGILVSNADIGIKKEAQNYYGNNHGSIENINGQEYVFYHRQTNRDMFARQACAEKLFTENGKFIQSEMTSTGLEDDFGKGKYPAYCACNLRSEKGAYGYGFFRKRKGIHPFFTQSGKDREEKGSQYISNMRNGSEAQYKYFTAEDVSRIGIEIKTDRDGIISVFADGEKTAEFRIGRDRTEYEQSVKCKFNKTALKFRYEGKGKADFISFTIE